MSLKYFNSWICSLKEDSYTIIITLTSNFILFFKICIQAYELILQACNPAPTGIQYFIRDCHLVRQCITKPYL